jgi:5-formyltetrahydrofolate cyclo-ligase
MNAKAAMRAQMIARRDALAPGERARLARELAARLAALPAYESARTVLATMSIGS